MIISLLIWIFLSAILIVFAVFETIIWFLIALIIMGVLYPFRLIVKLFGGKNERII